MRTGPELAFFNGAVFDGTGFAPIGTVVRVSNGRITYVGQQSEAGPLASAEPVDLGGGTLFPGFIDAHVHPVFAGDRLCRCDLADVRDSAEYLAIIAAYAATHPHAEWITGGGWSMEAFPGGVPTKDLLDGVVNDRPVFLPNRDGHGAWVNSRALELAGITKATPDPADGRIERDASGEPVGMLQEGAQGLVSRLLPATSADDWYSGLLAGQDYLLSLGITGWQDAIVGRSPGMPDPIDAYLRGASKGTLVANVVGALWWDRDRGLDQLPELLDRRRSVGLGGRPPGPPRDGAAGRFRATSVKIMLDGVAENHTAAMLEPYLDGHGCATEHSGLDFIDPEELPRFVTALDREGFQVHFHALGDRAVRNALDAIQAARTANGDSGISHHLAHLQVVHPDDISRFARLSATANIQPLWATHEPQMDELTIPFLGERRSSWQYPFGSLLAAGAALCAGSDWSVSSPDPLLGAHVAVNRSLPADGSTADPFLPEQALSPEAIFAAYTSGSARVNGLADTTGSVRAGLDADFAIVNADLANGAADEIGTAAVVQTWVRGELRYQRS